MSAFDVPRHLVRYMPRVPARVSLGLLVIGIAGMVLGPVAIGRLAAVRTRSYDRTHGAAPSVATPLAVRTPQGQLLGWLRVTYPRTIRQNQDAPIDVLYKAQPDTWKSAAKGPVSLAVAIRVNRLTVQPKPYTYRFDTARITRSGQDNHIWVLSSKQEGDYTLVLRLTAQPPDVQVRHIEVNGTPAPMNSAEVALPVRVETRYDVPQAVVDLGKAIAATLSFLLTLPAVKLLAERYLKPDLESRK